MNYKITAKAMSRKDIRRKANNFRNVLGLEGVVYVDVLKILERALPILGIQYEIIDKDSMVEEGRTFPEKNMIHIREDVYEGARNGNGRDRFTIMHEIAHAILHNGQNVSFARGGKYIPPYEDPEWQADAFTGEFLMPSYIIRYMNPEEISVKCGVSITAAKYQFKINNH